MPAPALMRRGYQPQMHADERRHRTGPGCDPLRRGLRPQSWFECREKARRRPVCPWQAFTDALSHGTRTMTVQREALAAERAAASSRLTNLCSSSVFNCGSSSLRPLGYGFWIAACLGARPRINWGRAHGACGASSRREDEAMSVHIVDDEQRGDRPAIPMRPSGSGGAGGICSVGAPRRCTETSPASRRLASAPAALGTRPLLILGRAPRDTMRLLQCLNH